MNRPPNWKKILEKAPAAVFAMGKNPAVAAVLKKANERYDYWDKFRSQPGLRGANKEQAWAYLKHIRDSQKQEIPLRDIEGENFWFWLPSTLVEALFTIDRVATEDSVEEKLAIKSLMEEAITSSQIEGATMTVRDAKEMLLANRRPKTLSEQMIRNNYSTMQLIKTNYQEPLSPELFLSLHRSIAVDTLDHREQLGRYRLSEENIQVVDTYGNVLFIPPPAEELPERIDQLCQFVNEDDSIHPVLKAIILHFWVAYLHPFVDGNGRAARALFYWYLLRKGYWLFEYVSISSILVGKSAQYGRAYLYSEIDECDLTYFLQFNLRVILEAIDLVKKCRDKEREVIAYPNLNMRQAHLLTHAKRHARKIYTIKQHQSANGIAYQTARTDLLGLVEKGYFKQIEKGKTFYFCLDFDDTI